MACLIKDKATGEFLQKHKLGVERGFFQSEAFFKSFGANWTTENLEYKPSDPLNQVNKDGSPRIYFNKAKTKIFYVDKNKNKVNIPIVQFSSIPADDRAEISYAINDAIMSELQKELQLISASFQDVGLDMTLSEFYDMVREDILEHPEGVSDVIRNSLNEDKEDHLKLLNERLKGLGIKYSEREAYVDEEGEEIDRADLAEDNDGNFAVVQKPSYERSAAKNANSEIKFMLEFIPEMKASGENVASDYIPGAVRLMDPSTVFAILLENISNVPSMLQDPDDYTQVRTGEAIGQNSVQAYISKLEGLIPKYPWIRSITNTLNNLPDEHRERFQMEFVSVFANARNHIYTYEVDNSGMYTIKDTSQTGKDTQFLIRDWSELLGQKIYSGDESLEVNRQKFSDAIKRTTGKVTDFAENAYKDIENRNDLDYNIGKLFEIVSPVFEYLDFGIDEDVFKNYVNGALINSRNDSVLASIKGAGIEINTLLDKLIHLSNSDNQADMTKYSRARPNKLALLAESYSNIHIPVADYMATVGQKRIYLYSAPTVLQRQIEEFKQDPRILDVIKDDVKSLDNSVWLNHFRTNDAALKRLKVGLRGQTQLEGESVDGADNKNVKKADYVKGEIFAALRNARFGADPLFATQIPADKNREYVINPGIFLEFKTIDDVYNVFEGYVKDEIAKMYEAHQEIQNEVSKAIREIEEKKKISIDDLSEEEQAVIINEAYEKASNGLIIGYTLDKKGNIVDDAGNYSGDAFRFRLFESLNPVVNEDGVEDWGKNKFMKPLITMIKSGSFPTQAIDKFVDSVFEDVDFKTEFKDHVVNVLESILSSEINYFTGLETGYSEDQESPAFNSIDAQIKNKYKAEFGEEGAADNDSRINTAIMRDYVFNSMISRIEYAKIFTGALQYYKSDADYIKRVPATYIDGKPLMTGVTEGDLTFNVMTFNTENILNSDLRNDGNLSPSVQAYYNKVDRTDAQGWITPDRWEFILKRTGKLNRDSTTVLRKLKNQWAAIEKNEPIKDEDQLSGNEVKILSAQPLKGVYFKNDLLHGPVYVKYSQAVLIPSVAANQPKMKALMKAMKSKGIDEAVADSGVKVGSLKAVSLEDNFVEKDGELTLEIPDARVSKLDNRNWRLQQDLPTKTVKDNKIGTQIQKIIISGLRTMSSTEEITPGYTAHQLADAIDNSLKELSDEGIKKFKSEYGINEDNVVESLEEFYAPILRDIAGDGIPFLNLKEALEDEVPLAALPNVRAQVIANFMSKLKKSATNLLTSGGGFIQISDHLMSLDEINANSGIKLLVNDVDRLQPPKVVEDKNGRKVVIPGQIFIPHKKIAKLIPNYKDMDINELRGMLTREALEVIGYRIPTQSRASTDILEVVGILPEEMGDSIIAYGEITSKTGSDFDIDKMFFMMPELEMYEGVVQKKLEGQAGLRNKVFDLFSKALRVPALYEAMMTSIDNDTTEVMISSMLPSPVKNDLFVFTPSVAVETRFNLKAGASGIGDMVNANNDHTRSQGRGITFEADTGKLSNGLFDEALSNFLDNSPNLNNKDVEDVIEQIVLSKNSELKGSALKAAVKEYLQVNNRRPISDVLSEMTNAFVDIANKNAFVTRANWGALTNSYGTMLIRSGVHPLRVFSMIRNPAITDLLDRSATSEGIIYHESINKIKDSIKEELLAQYKESLARLSDEEYSAVESISNIDDLNIKVLFDTASSQELITPEEIKTAIVVYNHFIEMTGTVRKYGRAVTTAKVGENGVGKSFGSYVALTNKLTDAMEKTELGTGFDNLINKYYDEKLNKTLLMTFHENTVGILEKIATANPEIFGVLTEDNINTINNIYADSSRNNIALNEYNIDQIFEAANTLFLADFAPLAKVIENEERLRLEDKFFELRKTGDYPILNKLFSSRKDDGSLLIYSNKINLLSNKNKNIVSSSWSKLLKDHKDLGEFLIRESYKNTGFQNKLGSYHEVIPYKWFIDNDILSHVKGTKNMPYFFEEQLAVNDIGKNVFNVYAKMKDMGDGFKSVEKPLSKKGAGKNRVVKFAKYARSFDGSIHKLIGKSVSVITPKTGKTTTEVLGIYKELPTVPEDKVFYSNSEYTFNSRMGIQPIEEYEQEFQAIPDKKSWAAGTTVKKFFLPLNSIYEQDYRKDHVTRINLEQDYINKQVELGISKGGDSKPNINNEPKCKG